MYEAEIQWVDIKKDEQGFVKFLEGVLAVLDSPELPEPARDCKWCNYYAKLAKVAIA